MIVDNTNIFNSPVRNVSAKEDGQTDTLILDRNSRVWADTTITRGDEGASKANTGLENSARVGFVLYSNNIDINAVETGGKSVGQQVREIEAGGSEKVAIWEPNYKEHTSYVISNDTRVKALIDAAEGDSDPNTVYEGYVTKPLLNTTTGTIFTSLIIFSTFIKTSQYL